MLDEMGVSETQLPVVTMMGHPGGTIPGTDTVFTGGSIDAFCDQIVAGDVGAGRCVGDLRGHPHRLGHHHRVAPGPGTDQLPAHHARSIHRGRPEQRRRPLRRLGPAPLRAACPSQGPTARRWPLGWVDPIGSPSGCPTSGASAPPSRITVCARTSTGSTSARTPRRWNGPPSRPAASSSGACSTWRAWPARPGGSWPAGEARRVTAWMAAVADATNLPVETVAVPDGAARGAAYLARMAAGLETSLDDSSRWGRRPAIEPDPAWVRRRRGALPSASCGHRRLSRRRLVAPATRWG